MRESWKAGRQHRGPRLVYDEVRPTAAVPLQDVRGDGQPEYGHRVQWTSLHTEGVRSGREPASRGREHFCGGPRHGAFPQHHRPLLERASRTAERFNQQTLRDFDIVELQADELCTFIGSKNRPTWLFATIEVCSRLWASSLVGRRSSRNTTAVLNDVILRGRLVGFPLIATDGLEYYCAVILRLIGPACVYGQVIKTRRNNRVVRVERRVKIGTARQLKDALLKSEDSEPLNTSFIERLNLFIRQGSAYLHRRAPCHARGEDQLRGHVELLSCHYNFVRPHRSLQFGRETRTPAMQAGLVSTRMNWRDIFTARGLSLRILVAVVRIPVTVQLMETGAAALPTLSWPHEHRTAA